MTRDWIDATTKNFDSKLVRIEPSTLRYRETEWRYCDLKSLTFLSPWLLHFTRAHLWHYLVSLSCFDVFLTCLWACFLPSFTYFFLNTRLSCLLLSPVQLSTVFRFSEFRPCHFNQFCRPISSISAYESIGSRDVWPRI